MNTNDHILENDKIKKRFSMLPQCGMNFKASQTLPPFETVITICASIWVSVNIQL